MLKTILNPFLKSLRIQLVVVISIGTFAHAQRSVRIGYVDTEYILENVTDYQNALQQLEQKALVWKSEMETQLSEINKQKDQLNIERVLLTPELIKDREEDIQALQDILSEYQQNRFGPTGDLFLQKKQLMQPVQDQIFAAVQEIASSKKYDFIFDKSADVVMLYSADRYDISEQILRTINRASKRKQLESKKDKKAAEEEDIIVAIEKNNDKEIRQKQLDERAAARESILEERKAERLAQEEERKKAAEEKKAEKLAADLARKKAAEEKKAEKLALIEKRKQEQEAQKEARKKAIEEKKAAQKALIEKRKKEQLERIEAQKKRAEERRKKLLEDREARIEAQKRKIDSIKNNKQ